MKKFFYTLAAITVALSWNPSLAEDVYYCELVKSFMVDGSTRDQVNEYSGNKFKFAIKSDKIDFSDRNFVFLDEYSLSGQRGPYLTTEVKFSQISPSQFFYQQIKSYTESSTKPIQTLAIQTISYNDGALEAVLYVPNIGGINYSHSKCDKF